MNKILIKIEGGLIQSIGSTDPNIQVVVIDYDEFENFGYEEGETIEDAADRAVSLYNTYDMPPEGKLADQISDEQYGLSENEEAVKAELEAIDAMNEHRANGSQPIYQPVPNEIPAD